MTGPSTASVPHVHVQHGGLWEVCKFAYTAHSSSNIFLYLPLHVEATYWTRDLRAARWLDKHGPLRRLYASCLVALASMEDSLADEAEDGATAHSRYLAAKFSPM